MEFARTFIAALSLAASASALASGDTSPVAACELNFTVDGSWSSGRVYATEAEVPGASYPEALYRVRDKIVEQGLDIIAVQEKNGFIRAANPVTGGEGGTANAPVRVYVTPLPAGGVNVSASFTIAGGQITSKKAVRSSLCEMVAAAG